MKKMTGNLDSYADRIRADLEKKDAAREKVLPLCRELIRYASITIRAIHRQEFDEAKKLLAESKKVKDSFSPGYYRMGRATLPRFCPGRSERVYRS